MEKELRALRKVAHAAKVYQEKVIQKRSLQLVQGMNPKEMQNAMLDIGSAEFELSEALNDWYRTTRESS